MDVHFFITEEAINNMEARDYEAFERAQDGEVKMYRIRPALCRFMVDEKNVPVPYDQALKISERMKIKEIKDFIGKFFEALQNAAVPKANGSRSKLPSEAPMVGSQFQDGSQP